MMDESNSNGFECPIDGAPLTENRSDSTSTVFAPCPECGIEWEWLLDEAEMVVSVDPRE